MYTYTHIYIYIHIYRIRVIRREAGQRMLSRHIATVSLRNYHTTECIIYMYTLPAFFRIRERSGATKKFRVMIPRPCIVWIILLVRYAHRAVLKTDRLHNNIFE